MTEPAGEPGGRPSVSAKEPANVLPAAEKTGGGAFGVLAAPGVGSVKYCSEAAAGFHSSASP
jgi:hypothetical protein